MGVERVLQGGWSATWARANPRYFVLLGAGSALSRLVFTLAKRCSLLRVCARLQGWCAALLLLPTSGLELFRSPPWSPLGEQCRHYSDGLRGSQQLFAVSLFLFGGYFEGHLKTVLHGHGVSMVVWWDSGLWELATSVPEVSGPPRLFS